MTATAGLREEEFLVRIWAIDRLGLEGDARTIPGSLVRREPAATGFLAQLWRDAEFSWLQFNAATAKSELTLSRPPFSTYFARVQVQNANGSTGPLSATQGFVVTDQWIIHESNPIAAQLGRRR